MLIIGGTVPIDISFGTLKDMLPHILLKDIKRIYVDLGIYESGVVHYSGLKAATELPVLCSVLV